MRYQFFFDESGKSNLSDASQSGQRLLVLAGVLIPWDSLFWAQVKPAWTHAATLLGIPPGQIELHGTDIYGGKGSWAGVEGRREILDTVIHALLDNDIRIYWTGLPIEKLKAVEKNAWRKVLTLYLNLLDRRLHADLNGSSVEVYGDVNDWVGVERALENDAWLTIAEQRAQFHDSKAVHGLQIADIVAHTLYRSNKISKSSTDSQAEVYRLALSKNFIHLPSNAGRPQN